MSAIPRTQAEREDVLASLVRLPDAVLAAIASDGVLVPMPASVGVPPGRVMAPPADRATILDAIVPAEAMTVIGAWERARLNGVGLATVHGRREPEVPLSLSFVDVRETHGVFVGALDVLVGEGGGDAAAPLAGLEVSRRPRTATVRKTALAVITEIDERTTRMLGWTPAQMVGQRSSEFVHPDDQERAIANWLELLSRQDAQRVRLRHRRADGTWAWLELENQYVPADDPADATVVTQMSDVSDEMAAHEALRQQERLLRRLTESLPQGIVQLTVDREVVHSNSRLPVVLGLPAVRGWDDVAAVLDETGLALLDAALTRALTDGEDGSLELAVSTPAGEARVCAVSLVALGDREGAPGALVCVSDVTDSARMREELTAKATFDPLTGCHNRASTMAVLEAALAADSTAVVFVDLDEFKPVNDTLGHDAGDELLVTTATRLAGVLRRDDIVGRIGGDEFLVVSRGVDGPEAAAALGARIRAALAVPAEITAGTVPLQASLGIAWAGPGTDPAALTKRADQAMYVSKQGRRGEPVLWREEPVPV
ncbi:sensor domain-containing protein [Geodermatophilus nigrescens]|uniref:PAS domain S-box-containing protein/diguanylate cyclase (GGDEF) domain-containing protein n=1 Tax=Geodermatophilus nigrescens TaxID=1070870 RepID=A0A1M5IM63_9ACTN|nr:GGDEF domain-containing protein [Geodermatophilus nigrescens]SHG29336.1 PAS domain S-box-containing protein/diguanylate cyclase (GGDEF) domain-containing protein [Geodermatophilus nigrescens]